METSGLKTIGGSSNATVIFTQESEWDQWCRAWLTHKFVFVRVAVFEIVFILVVALVILWKEVDKHVRSPLAFIARLRGAEIERLPDEEVPVVEDKDTVVKQQMLTDITVMEDVAPLN